MTILEEKVMFTEICPLSAIDVETGVAALVEGRVIAVFRTYSGEIFALSNLDPISGASVLSRGIVGTRTVNGAAVDYVASPIFKEGFDLRTGRCLDKPGVAVNTHETEVREGVVFVSSTPKASVEE